MAKISVPIIVNMDMDVIIEKFKEEGWMPVVRCKDCKYALKHCENGNVICNRITCGELFERGKDWFCADGERMEGR